MDLISLKWLTPFSANDPVNTPRTLNVLDPFVETAFADAVASVTNSSFALDAPMGDIQSSGVNGQIPIFGGEGFEGSFTIASSGALGDSGYPVTYGNSYIQAVTWDLQSGAPNAQGFVTYSQSTDPASPYYNDMTQAYSAKQWVDYPFTPEQIAGSRVLESYVLSE